MSSHLLDRTSKDEEYPLLKMSAVVEDTTNHKSSGWAVTCSRKRAWKERWPGIFYPVILIVTIILAIPIYHK